MIKLEDIMTEINTKLQSFGIEINENDVQEGFSRPSFFVKFDQVYRTQYKDSFLREIMVLLYYFPNSRYKYQLEIMEMQQNIEEILKDGLAVKDRHIHISDDIESEVVDGILQMSFDLEFYDKTDEGEVPGPLMEELYFNE